MGRFECGLQEAASVAAVIIRALVVVVGSVCSAAALADDVVPPDRSPASAAAVALAAAADADVDDENDLAAAAPAKSLVPPESIESLVGMPSTADMLMPFIKTMLMLGVVLALVWLTLHKGMGKLVEKAQSGKRVRVVERISLDARRTLFLVEVDGKQMILAGGDVVRITDADLLAPALKQERAGLFDKVLAAAGRPATARATTTTTSTAETENASS